MRAAFVLIIVVLIFSGCASQRDKGWSVDLSSGPHMRIERGEESTVTTGDAAVNIQAGEDVGYHVEFWRNKSAPNINSSVEGE